MPREINILLLKITRAGDDDADDDHDDTDDDSHDNDGDGDDSHDDDGDDDFRRVFRLKISSVCELCLPSRGLTPKMVVLQR